MTWLFHSTALVEKRLQIHFICWLEDLNLLNIECDSEKQTETYDVKQNIFNTREGGQPK